MKQRGFTVIELIIVIALVGMIGGVILRGFVNAKDADGFWNELAAMSFIGLGIGAVYLVSYKLFGKKGADSIDSMFSVVRVALIVLVIVYLGYGYLVYA